MTIPTNFHIKISVTSPSTACAFYQTVFGAEKLSESDNEIMISINNINILLYQDSFNKNSRIDEVHQSHSIFCVKFNTTADISKVHDVITKNAHRQNPLFQADKLPIVITDYYGVRWELSLSPNAT
jgi:hypothetical protein